MHKSPVPDYIFNASIFIEKIEVKSYHIDNIQENNTDGSEWDRYSFVEYLF